MSRIAGAVQSAPPWPTPARDVVAAQATDMFYATDHVLDAGCGNRILSTTVDLKELWWRLREEGK